MIGADAIGSELANTLRPQRKKAFAEVFASCRRSEGDSNDVVVGGGAKKTQQSNLADANLFALAHPLTSGAIPFSL